MKQCRKCTERRIIKKEPMIPSVVADRPWQVIGTNICYVKKRPYLIVVDYFSKFIEVNYLASLASSETIRALKSVFARHGIPEVERSDNGPQYDSAEFAKFAKGWEFKHVTSSSLYAESNGEVERANQTAKNLLQKESDPAKALLAYRSTPLQGGKNPSELLFGRQIRTGSERKVKERSSKNSITTHGTESRSYTHCSPAIECGSKVKTSQAQSGSSSRISRALTQ